MLLPSSPLEDRHSIGEPGSHCDIRTFAWVAKFIAGWSTDSRYVITIPLPFTPIFPIIEILGADIRPGAFTRHRPDPSQGTVRDLTPVPFILQLYTLERAIVVSSRFVSAVPTRLTFAARPARPAFRATQVPFWEIAFALLTTAFFISSAHSLSLIFPYCTCPFDGNFPTSIKML